MSLLKVINMKEIIYLIALIISCYNTLFLLYLYQQQYYSIKRFFKFKFSNLINKITIKMPLFYLLSYLVYTYHNKTMGLIIILLSQCLLLTKIRLKDYHFTRRFCMLLFFSILISLTLYNVLYFSGSNFLGILCLFICNYLGLILSSFLLYPLEKLIKEYYIRKARNKVKKNKYIVIGVTGSFGKTSMKNILYSLLKTKYKISFQNHNYNTLLGLAKYINNYVKDDDEILIVELGVDEVNTMIKFKKLFMLDIALITSIGNMHLSTFKTLDNIIKEKMAISKLLKDNGSLFINKDDCAYVSDYEKVIYTSKDDLIFYDELPYKLNLYDKVIKTELYLEYQLSYLSLVLSVCELLSLDKEEIIFGIENIIIPDRRFKITKSERDTIIDNSYNSNEKGFKLSVDLIKKYDDFKVVVTGGLFELGSEFNKINTEIGRYLKDVDLLILISEDVNHPLKKGFISNSRNEFIQLDDFNKVNDVISKIDKKKIILYTAIGSNVSLK